MMLIKLVDARKGLHEKCIELLHDEKVAESIYMYLCDGLEECDVIEPERKTGKWEQVNEQPYFRKHFSRVCCSVCRVEGMSKWNFCPACGADMRGEQNG